MNSCWLHWESRIHPISFTRRIDSLKLPPFSVILMMNCFCGMVDRRKAFSLISSLDHCQKSSPSRISGTPRAGFEPAQNLSSGLVELSCAVVVITTTPRRHSSFFFSLDLTKSLLSHHFEDPYSPFHSHLYQLLPQILLDLIPEVLTPWYNLLYGIPHLDVQTFSWPNLQDYPCLFHLYVTLSKLKGSYISRYIILIVCFLIIDANHCKRYLHLQ